jgi:alcohol dehydrogenase YqhD (iron-dependent ADH family)
MQNFIYDRCTKVIFGKDTESAVGAEVKRHTDKVMLHFGGGSIKKTGLYDRVMKSLKNGGVEVVELGGVVPNPKLGLVRKGIDMCRKEQVGLILAVGGGSVIDSAKAIAVGTPYKGDVWDFAENRSVPEKALPVGVILTIPAAGSETSQYSVITNDEGEYPLKRDVVVQNQQVIRPEFAIMNPELTFTLPPFQTACGVSDILSHVIERYFTSVQEVELTDRLCEATMKTVMHNGPIVLREPENYAARAEIMWANSIAHNDLLGTGRTGDWSSHMIEHELSALYDLTHGAGLAIVIPAWMKYVYRYNLPRFAQFATRVMNVDTNFESLEQTCLEGIEKLEAFYTTMGLPTRLKDVSIPDDKFEVMAEKSVKTGSIRKLAKDDVVEIYRIAV